MDHSAAANSNRKHTSPKDVFLHLLSILALYVSVFSFITLLFQYINWLYPDALNFYQQGILNSIRWSTASLIVVFPVYLFSMWLLYRDMSAEPEKAQLRIRKWLTYFTLFLAAITIIVDLVTLIYNFLSGELTLPFVLKILVVLVVAGVVFGYYLWDLKRQDRRTYTRLLASAVSVAVLASIVAGFFIVGSPFYQRKVRFDEQRQNDLQILQSQIVNHWQQKGRLPTGLDQLTDSISGFTPPVDPVTGAVYEYQATGSLSFELCAQFETAQHQTMTKGVPVRPIPSYGNFEDNWTHDLGRVCFPRTIDPDLYRVPGAPVKM